MGDIGYTHVLGKNIETIICVSEPFILNGIENELWNNEIAHSWLMDNGATVDIPAMFVRKRKPKAGQNLNLLR
jgi:hypothetical protein